MKKAQFFVDCIARYKVTDFPLPDEFFDGNKLIVPGKQLFEYIEEHLDTISATDLEWVNDCMDDPVYEVHVYNDDEEAFMNVTKDGDMRPNYKV